MIDTYMERIKKSLGELDEEVLEETLNDFIATNPSIDDAYKVITACQEGMAVVGDLFESGEYFVGDLIFAGELLKEVIDILKSVINSDLPVKVGKVVLGTVHGDLHDIGKNIFKTMAEAAGFEVYDLGIDQPIEVFVDRVKEVKPDILGMSGFLILSQESMKDTVEAIKKAGLRDTVKIIIGGNAVTRESCEYIGANAFAINAVEGVKIVQEWVKY